MTVFFVECKSCQEEIEVLLTSGHKSADTLFAITWNDRLQCACGKTHDYDRSDVLYRHEGERR